MASTTPSASGTDVDDNVHNPLAKGAPIRADGRRCLYLKDLPDNDLDVLESVITKSWTALTDGTFARRAREAGRREP